LYTLAKQGKNLGANKLAQQVMTQMQHMKIPSQFQVNSKHTQKEQEKFNDEYFRKVSSQ
jgi:hypothetical protein